MSHAKRRRELLIGGAAVEAQMASLLNNVDSLSHDFARAMDCGLQLAETGAACAP